MAVVTAPQQQLASLAATLKAIGNDLSALQAQLAQTGANTGTVAALTTRLAQEATTIAETLPLPEPPPVPVGPKPIPPSAQLPIRNPRSNTAFPMGMGQNAAQAAAWEKLHGPLGAVALWSNNAKEWTWDIMRGGEKGRPDRLGKAFTIEYAANINLFPSYLNQFPDVPIVIMYPMLPSVRGISNMGKGGKWQNPGIWKNIIANDLDLWKSVWKDYGAHLCYWAKMKGRNCIGICIGWELTGRWYDWSIGPQWRSFPDCWRWLAESLYAGIESVDPAMVDRIHLEMRVAGGVSQRLDGYSLRDIFPGRDFVRVLGASMHESSEESWGTTAGFNAELKTGPAEVVQLCQEVGLPLGLDEINITSQSIQYFPASKAPATALQNFFAWTRSLPVPVAWCCWLQSSKANALDQKWPGCVELGRQLNTMRAHFAALQAAAAAVEDRQQIVALQVLEDDANGAVPSTDSGSATA